MQSQLPMHQSPPLRSVDAAREPVPVAVAALDSIALAFLAGG